MFTGNLNMHRVFVITSGRNKYVFKLVFLNYMIIKMWICVTVYCLPINRIRMILEK